MKPYRGAVEVSRFARQSRGVLQRQGQHLLRKAPLRTAFIGVTQFGRTLYELNIDAFCANTSRAKGRVERANLTLQDRLVKELRLRAISTSEAANAYAPCFIAKFNRRSGKPPKSDYDARRPMRANEDLRQILAFRVPRKVANALTVQYDPVMYLLEDSPANRTLIHEYIEVIDIPMALWKYKPMRSRCRARRTTALHASNKARRSRTNDLRRRWR